MAISQEAQRNHAALFPDHQSTLQVTDPELIEIFDNWAFDEVDFLHVTNEVLQSRGVALPLPPQSTTTSQTRLEKGLEVQKRVLGDRIDALYAQSPKDQLHIQRFLSANCFGDYYTRTGLDLQTRELLTFSMIASLGGCEPQLAGHVAANLAVGNDRRILLSTITQLLPFIGYPRTLNAIRVINEGTSA
jgi:4-carboxymuconolactone decarboxylase